MGRRATNPTILCRLGGDGGERGIWFGGVHCGAAKRRRGEGVKGCDREEGRECAGVGQLRGRGRQAWRMKRRMRKFRMGGAVLPKRCACRQRAGEAVGYAWPHSQREDSSPTADAAWLGYLARYRTVHAFERRVTLSPICPGETPAAAEVNRPHHRPSEHHRDLTLHPPPSSQRMLALGSSIRAATRAPACGFRFARHYSSETQYQHLLVSSPKPGVGFSQSPRTILVEPVT